MTIEGWGANPSIAMHAIRAMLGLQPSLRWPSPLVRLIQCNDTVNVDGITADELKVTALPGGVAPA